MELGNRETGESYTCTPTQLTIKGISNVAVRTTQTRKRMLPQGLSRKATLGKSECIHQFVGLEGV